MKTRWPTAEDEFDDVKLCGLPWPESGLQSNPIFASNDPSSDKRSSKKSILLKSPSMSSLKQITLFGSPFSTKLRSLTPLYVAEEGLPPYKYREIF